MPEQTTDVTALDLVLSALVDLDLEELRPDELDRLHRFAGHIRTDVEDEWVRRDDPR